MINMFFKNLIVSKVQNKYLEPLKYESNFVTKTPSARLEGKNCYTFLVLFLII